MHRLPSPHTLTGVLMGSSTRLYPPCVWGSFCQMDVQMLWERASTAARYINSPASSRQAISPNITPTIYEKDHIVKYYIHYILHKLTHTQSRVHSTTFIPAGSRNTPHKSPWSLQTRKYSLGPLTTLINPSHQSLQTPHKPPGSLGTS